MLVMLSSVKGVNDVTQKTNKKTVKDFNKKAKRKDNKSGTSKFVKVFIILMSIAMLVPLLGTLLFQIF